MSKMRHMIDGRLRQRTADPCGGTGAELNSSPAAFSLNLNTALCLPVLSESQKLVWVHSDQVDTQLGCRAELDGAFDRFPYLTEKQTAALAKRCSLDPDQVKVWFMVQRLRYGISWDYKDIREVQRKFKAGCGKAQTTPDLRDMSGVKEKRRKKTEVKLSGGKKTGKVRVEENANEGRMMEENVGTDEQLVRKTEQSMNKDKNRKSEADKRNCQKKQKSAAVTDTMRRKRMKQDSRGTVERAEEEEMRGRPTTQTEGRANRLTSLDVGPVDESFVVPDESLDVSRLLLDVLPLSDVQTEVLEGLDVVAPTAPNSGMAPVNRGSEAKLEGETRPEREDKLGELMNINPSEASSSTSRPSRLSHCSTKSYTQLKMMKMAFSHCQYPNSEDYDRMARLIDLPRCTLVKWFSDMRYYIKKMKPGWMNQEQHRQALANVSRSQRCKLEVKVKGSEGSRKRTKKEPGR